MNTLTRTIRFVIFTLTEYARSGRILIELLATLVFFYIFLWRGIAQPDYFFTTASLFTLVLTFSPIAAAQNLGDRPQGYLILVRMIGRGAYLLGLYLTAMLVVLALYVLISIAGALTQRLGFDMRA